MQEIEFVYLYEGFLWEWRYLKIDCGKAVECSTATSIADVTGPWLHPQNNFDKVKATSLERWSLEIVSEFILD